MAELAAIIGTIVVLISSMVTVTGFIVTMKSAIANLEKKVTEMDVCIAAYRSKHEDEHHEMDNRTFENQRKISNVEENIQFIKDTLMEIKKTIEDGRK